MVLQPSERRTLHRLTFVPAKYAKKRQLENHLNSNIILLNGIDEEGSEGKSGAMHSKSSDVSGKRKKREGSNELFAQDDLCMQWAKVRRVGSGLCNLGNTCFMNSVLQCLIHTPPLAELLLSGRQLAHQSHHGDLDPIQITQKLVHESLRARRDYLSPMQHAKSLKLVNRGFRLGRQEDAHEYLIALLDAMHDRSIAGMNPKPTRDLEYTSFIYRIFGGKIRSQLKCTQCDYESNTYDPFLDLSLEISRANSVHRALHRFTAGEVLDGANSYKCPKQKKMVRAIKRMTIEDPPNVLIIQLKRFEFSRSGRKISKHVDFEPSLDLSPFLSHKTRQPMLYDLYGILVHQGYSMHSGHYYCFLKGTGGGEWHKFDDTRVCATSARNALGQSPYILFYIRRTPAKPPQPRSGKENLKEKVPSSHERIQQNESNNSMQNSKRKEQQPRTPKTRDEHKLEPRRSLKERFHEMSSEGNNREKSKDKDSNQHQSSAAFRTKIEDKITIKEANTVTNGDASLAASKRRLKRGIISPIRVDPLSSHRIGLRDRQTGILLSASKLRNGKRRLLATSPNEPSSVSKKSPQIRALASTPNPQNTRHTIKKGKQAAESLVVGSSEPEVSLGLDTWDGINVSNRKQRDKNMKRTMNDRKIADEYDLEYDKGKTKKIKTKRETPGLTSAAFDAVAKSLRSVRNAFGRKRTPGFR
eukprot:jgi/Picsp_1/2709/NSC_00938-R1_protein